MNYPAASCEVSELKFVIPHLPTRQAGLSCWLVQHPSLKNDSEPCLPAGRQVGMTEKEAGMTTKKKLYPDEEHRGIILIKFRLEFPYIGI